MVVRVEVFDSVGRSRAQSKFYSLERLRFPSEIV